jgi:hypothetical protein
MKTEIRISRTAGSMALGLQQNSQRLGSATQSDLIF